MKEKNGEVVGYLHQFKISHQYRDLVFAKPPAQQSTWDDNNDNSTFSSLITIIERTGYRSVAHTGFSNVYQEWKFAYQILGGC